MIKVADARSWYISSYHKDAYFSIHKHRYFTIEHVHWRSIILKDYEEIIDIEEEEEEEN